MKELFIKSIQNAADSDDLDFVIERLEPCFAKGYITAKLEVLTDSTDDFEELRESILGWAEYNIWL